MILNRPITTDDVPNDERIVVLKRKVVRDLTVELGIAVQPDEYDDMKILASYMVRVRSETRRELEYFDKIASAVEAFNAEK